jgi:hypothetical protein
VHVPRAFVLALLATTAVLAYVAAGCKPATGGGGGGTTTTIKATTTTTTTTPTSSTVDPTHLPLGDGKYSSSAKRGYIFTCQQSFDTGAGGAGSKGDWFNSDGSTWDSTKKRIVDGDVKWSSRLTTSVANGWRTFSGNDLPDHGTGVFPIASTDDVYKYDHNPNSINEQVLSVKIPSSPTTAAGPTCIRGEVGISLTGAAIFDGFDAGGRDAVAWEAQDSCGGHPQREGAYHYHNLTKCIADPGTGQSNLLGYAYDGFGIYGNRGPNGKAMTNADLDECHGTTSPVMWDGKLVTMYHYVATQEFPYTVGCFRGTPSQNQFTG